MNITVFTGAGVSAESGIPTFRDKLTGIWEEYKPSDVATIEAWNENPDLVSRLHKDLFDLCIDKTPNNAHNYIVELEKMGHNVNVITQNIDLLHEKAGSTNVYHLHGKLGYVECTETGEVSVLDDDVSYGSKTLNGGVWKPYTVLFGEMPHNIDECTQVLNETDLLLIIGTSFEITYVPVLLSSSITSKCRIVYVDPKPAKWVSSYFSKIEYIEKPATIGVKDIIL